MEPAIAASKGTLRKAYLLLVHKAPRQANKFIGQLLSDCNADIFIHIDKKSACTILPALLSDRRVYVIKDSIDIKWGDISLVDATLCLLKHVVNSGTKYDFVILKSGQDLMVKNGIENFLEQNRNKIFMGAQKITADDPRSYFWRINWPESTRKQYDSALHPFRILRSGLIRLYKIGFNAIPNNNQLPVDVYRGSQWFCIPGYIAEHILDFMKKNYWYYETLKNALAPDEYFFQTILMNSPYAKDNVCNNLTHIRFGQTYRNNNHPVTLTMNHVVEIESSGKYFARKFDEDVDSKVIDYFCNKK